MLRMSLPVTNSINMDEQMCSRIAFERCHRIAMFHVHACEARWHGSMQLSLIAGIGNRGGWGRNGGSTLPAVGEK